MLDALEASPSEQKEIRKQFGEILLFKFWRILLGQLPKGKKGEFLAFLKRPGTNKEKIAQWLKKENISITSESKEKMDAAFKDAAAKLVAALVKNIDEKKKARLIDLLKKEGKK